MQQRSTNRSLARTHIRAPIIKRHTITSIAGGSRNAVIPRSTLAQATSLRLISINIATTQPWSTGAAVGAGLTEQSTFTRRHTGVANQIATLTGTAIAVLTAGHAAHAIDANQAIAALCVVLTLSLIHI